MLHLVDWIGCVLAGRRTDAGRALVAADWARLDASLPVSLHDRCGLAFDLGALGSILEMDDVDRQGLLHPGPVVVPAALACVDDGGGRELLDALVIGYEAMVRLGRSVGAGHYAFFHSTSTCGGLGAAAAAGALLGLSDEQRVWALGNAVSNAGGFWQCRHEPVMTKPYHCADATRRGVMAALMAGRGVTGPHTVLEGVQGMFAAVCPDGRPERFLQDPHSAWLMHEVSFKPWPACRHAHAAIDAAIALRGTLDGASIEAVEVESYADAIAFCDRVSPRSEGEAKFSLQHSVAVALLDGPPEIGHFAQQALQRDEIVALRSRSIVAVNERFTAAYPRHFGAAVTVTTADGRRLSKAVDDAWGDLENPMEQDAVLAKFHTLAAHSQLDRGSAERLLAAALALADDAPVAELRSQLARSLSI